MVSSRKAAVTATAATKSPESANSDHADPDKSPVKSVVKKRKYTKKKAKSEDDATDSIDGESDVSSKAPKKRTKGSTAKASKKVSSASKKRATKSNDIVVDGKESDSVKPSSSPKSKSSPSPPKSKSKATKHQEITERIEIPKLWDTSSSKGSYTYRIASWNVAGLRALMRKHPEALSDLCKTYDLDMLCLQETKLQESHLDDPKLKIQGHLLVDEGYEAHYNCCTAKKGYSGTATFIRRHSGEKKAKQKTIDSFFSANPNESKKAEKHPELNISAEKVIPTGVSYGIGDEIDNEGRVIVVDFPFGSVVNVYVPNSGQKLERLDYRTKIWDKQLLEFMQKRQSERNLPVMWIGDLNVAHTAQDIWNDGAKHLAKQAGVTEVERESFQQQLNSGFFDAFRRLHPETSGQYSYWSQRAGNRDPNKGLRLDYFICSSDFFSEDSPAVIRDSYIVPDMIGSDHCPVILELEVKP